MIGNKDKSLKNKVNTNEDLKDTNDAIDNKDSKATSNFTEENSNNSSNNNFKNDSKIKSKDVEDDLSNLKQKLESEQTKANDYLDLLQRTQADFENYKKRVAKDIKDEVFNEKKNILLEFLNFKNILEMAYVKEDDEKVKTNINTLLSNYNNILKRLNVIEIDCLNKEFDYNHSECILKKETKDDSKKNKVIEVLEKGYLLNNKLIKPAKVIVGVKEE